MVIHFQEIRILGEILMVYPAAISMTFHNSSVGVAHHSTLQGIECFKYRELQTS